MDKLIENWINAHPDVCVSSYDDIFNKVVNIQMVHRETKKRITRNILHSDVEISLLLVLTDMYNQLKRDLKSYPEL